MSSVNCSGGSGYSIESGEAPWNNSSGNDYTIPFKGGYFPAPPADSLTDLRDEVSETLQEFFGIRVDAHHHEVVKPDNAKFRWCMTILLEWRITLLPYKKTVKGSRC